MPNIKSMTLLVWSASIAPPARKLIALRLAALHDVHQGCICISTGDLAVQAGISTNAARGHINALLAEKILDMTANADGNALGAARHYRFDEGRLRVLAATTGKSLGLLDNAGIKTEPRVKKKTTSMIFITGGGVKMVAVLIGPPGRRQVHFTRVPECDAELLDYGWVPISSLMSDCRGGAWHGYLSPHGDPDCAAEDCVELDWTDMEKLGQWVQDSALGRVESVVTA